MFEVIFEKLRVPIFERLLDASADRQRCIASNIANIATPGYKTKDVDFSQILEQSMPGKILGQRTDPRHMPIGGKLAQTGRVEIEESSSKVLKSGENNVDIDLEMAIAAENQLLYSATAKIIGSKFKALQKSIRGRV